MPDAPPTQSSALGRAHGALVLCAAIAIGVWVLAAGARIIIERIVGLPFSYLRLIGTPFVHQKISGLAKAEAWVVVASGIAELLAQGALAILVALALRRAAVHFQSQAPAW